MPEQEHNEPQYSSTTSLAKLGDRLQKGLIPAPGVAELRGLRGRAATMAIGHRLRDSWFQQLPLLPGLVSSFSQVAASREWTVTGTPRRASRSVDRLNAAAYVDVNGMLYEGWSAFMQRRIVDWLTLGMYGMIVPNKKAPIQYIDPVELTHNPPETRPRVLKVRGRPTWNDYVYDGERWSNKEIFLNHYLPIGATTLMAPLVPAIPLARLLYLIQQHDMSSVDGRKVKDIFLVADDNVKDALISALVQYAAMQTGEPNTESHGIPIVAANKRGGYSDGEKVSDLIAMLGISSIPEGLDRDSVWDQAAVEFSALTGMQVTEWYHVKTGAANRATERVNQERGRTKGPNYFCRQDQRFLNNSGILGRTSFAYVEEVDIQAQKDKAEVMLRLSEAVKNLNEAVGMAISPRALVRWLQHLGVFPTDDYLVDDIILLSEDPVKPDDMVDVPIENLLADQEQRDRERQIEREMEDAELEAEKQRLLIQAQTEAGGSSKEADAEKSVRRFIETVRMAAWGQPRPIPDYEQVTVDRNNNVIEQRLPVYPVAKIIQQDVEDELQDEYAVPDFEALEDEFDVLLESKS